MILYVILLGSRHSTLTQEDRGDQFLTASDIETYVTDAFRRNYPSVQFSSLAPAIESVKTFLVDRRQLVDDDRFALYLNGLSKSLHYVTSDIRTCATLHRFDEMQAPDGITRAHHAEFDASVQRSLSLLAMMTESARMTQDLSPEGYQTARLQVGELLESAREAMLSRFGTDEYMKRIVETTVQKARTSWDDPDYLNAPWSGCFLRTLMQDEMDALRGMAVNLTRLA